MHEHRFMQARLAICGFAVFSIAPPSIGRPIQYEVGLLGSWEVMSPGDPDGGGMGSISIDAPASRICVKLKADKIGPITIVHIHSGRYGTGGPPIIVFDEPDMQGNRCATAADTVKAIKTHPADYYLNVHTEDFPMGALRGQLPALSTSQTEESDERVILWSGPWKLNGNFYSAPGTGRLPTALLLNKANGDRSAYASLAKELARRGINSLRVDLRAHGDSTNVGKFMPGPISATDILEGTHEDVVAAIEFLKSHPFVDSKKIVIVGASYSAEAMAEAARKSGKYVRAYAAISPGSFSDESALAIDRSGAKWLMVRSENERSPSVKVAVDTVRERSKSAEIWVLDGSAHATDILDQTSTLVERLSAWINSTLNDHPSE